MNDLVITPAATAPLRNPYDTRRNHQKLPPERLRKLPWDHPHYIPPASVIERIANKFRKSGSDDSPIAIVRDLTPVAGTTVHRISLSNSDAVVLVDAEDYERMVALVDHWLLIVPTQGDTKLPYAAAKQGQTFIQFARELAGITGDRMQQVWHANGNRLDCRRSNVRVVSRRAYLQLLRTTSLPPALVPTRRPSLLSRPQYLFPENLPSALVEITSVCRGLIPAPLLLRPVAPRNGYYRQKVYATGRRQALFLAAESGMAREEIARWFHARPGEISDAYQHIWRRTNHAAGVTNLAQTLHVRTAWCDSQVPFGESWWRPWMPRARRQRRVLREERKLTHRLAVIRRMNDRLATKTARTATLADWREHLHLRGATDFEAWVGERSWHRVTRLEWRAIKAQQRQAAREAREREAIWADYQRSLARKPRWSSYRGSGIEDQWAEEMDRGDARTAMPDHADAVLARVDLSHAVARLDEDEQRELAAWANGGEYDKTIVDGVIGWLEYTVEGRDGGAIPSRARCRARTESAEIAPDIRDEVRARTDRLDVRQRRDRTEPTSDPRGDYLITWTDAPASKAATTTHRPLVSPSEARLLAKTSKRNTARTTPAGPRPPRPPDPHEISDLAEVHWRRESSLHRQARAETRPKNITRRRK